jgi:hypothetical protein
MTIEIDPLHHIVSVTDGACFRDQNCVLGGLQNDTDRSSGLLMVAQVHEPRNFIQGATRSRRFSDQRLEERRPMQREESTHEGGWCERGVLSIGWIGGGKRGIGLFSNR